MRQLVQPGTVQVPLLGMLLDGQRLEGVVSAEVQSNNHYQADTWKAELALNALGGHDMLYWGGDALVGKLFTVRMGLRGPAGDDIRTMIVGEADDIEVHPVSGRVSLSGRDLTARLIEAKTQENFLNQTSSQVATTLAGRHGLTPKVTATSTLISRYFSGNHDAVSHNTFSRSSTEWDLLTRLAGFEGFDVWVSGTELHFAPALDLASADPWAISPQLAILDSLTVKRSQTHAKGVTVAVESWNSGQGRGFTVHSGSTAAAKSGKGQQFVFTRPNLTMDQAQKLADNLREDISKHERLLSFDIPGELDLTARDALSLTGCGAWDQRYYVNTVSRRMSMAAGFTTSVTGKNHSPESQVSA